MQAFRFGGEMNPVMHLVARTAWRCGLGGIREDGMTTDVLPIAITSAKKLLVGIFIPLYD